MSKKNDAVEETQEEFQDDAPVSPEGDDSLSELNFDVTDEYKPDPLVSSGTYHGVATKITFEPQKFCIVWSFCLHDNDGVMSDGETPVDGSYVYYRNWLPKPGDEDVMSKDGKKTKRQTKINMLMDFQKNLNIDISTPSIISEGLADQIWIGVEADLEVVIDEWQGRFRNSVNKISASKMF
jgi:hypothetical protein